MTGGCTVAFQNTQLFLQKEVHQMLTVNTTTLNLVETWLDSDAEHVRVNVNFPLNRAAGTEGGAVVYFEIEPGHRLGRHTDSPEEILYIVAGTAEAEVGDERGVVTAGDLAVIPAMVPHAVRNIGDGTLKVIGFFSEPDVTSTFDEPVQPIGQSVVTMEPVPAAA
jgi:quercetin dioxygenase-like cupin family protein